MRMPPIADDLPDASYADAVFTVVTLRAAVVTGLVAGAIVPCIPFAILALVGLFGTFLLNRGTIDPATSYTIASDSAEAVALVFALLVVFSSLLGGVMGAVRRWSVQRNVSWQLLVGAHFSTHPGPQTAIAAIVAPLLMAGALHKISLDVVHRVSIAPALFFMFPLWSLSGFVYEAVWEPIVFLILRITVGEPMTWLRREAALVRLLKDDSELFGCRLYAVRIDSHTGVAHIRGDFRTPDHYRRAREIGMRIIGVNAVEAEGLTLLEREQMHAASRPDSLTDTIGTHVSAPLQEQEAASMARYRKALRATRNLWQALFAPAPRSSRNGGHDLKE